MEKDFSKTTFPTIKGEKYGEYEKAYIPVFEIQYYADKDTPYRATDQVYFIDEAYQKMKDKEIFKGSELDFGYNEIHLKYQEATLDSKGTILKKGDIVDYKIIHEQFKERVEIKQLETKIGNNEGFIAYILHNPKVHEQYKETGQNKELSM